MKIQKQVPLTEGPILKSLTGLAVPIMISSFLGTLYNITDMAWIGLLGSKAVAAVGVGGMYVWLSQGLASLARMGGQVHVAQCIGRGDREKAHGFAQAAVQLAAFMGMAYAILSLLFTRQMVGFFQLADAQAHAAAMSYTKIACGLIVFSFMTLTLTGLYTAQGDSKTPFIANLVGLATNMVLDPVLILGVGMFPKLGVVGAAIATVTAQAIVMSIMIVGIVIQKKENVLKGTRLLAKIPREYLQGICKIGIPTAIQGMAYCAISMVLTRMISGHIGNIAVCTAGTADIAVAEEAAQTAEYFGTKVTRVYDVGVSGIHRLLGNLEAIQSANCVVAVAGMEGALASVLGGLVDKPVIAVPTSVGYGANFGGLSALLTMINSCANGIAVVNIDNGYGAGYMATQINRLGVKANG